MSMLRWVTLAVAALATGCTQPGASNPVRPSPIPSGLTLTATPSSLLLSGSTATITARLVDTAGSPVSGATIAFATNTGTLSATTATTRAGGDASVTLTGAGSATVAATAVGVPGRQFTFTGLAPFELVIDGDAPVYVDGWNTGVRAVANAAAISPPRPAVLTFSCGDALPVSVNEGSRWCVFGTAGDYTVTASAATANGWSTTTSRRVTAAGLRASPAPLVPITLYSSETRRGESDASWLFSVDIGRVTVPIREYQWSFGDEETLVTSTNLARHDYQEQGDMTVRVTAVTAGGSGSATNEIAVRFVNRQ